MLKVQGSSELHSAWLLAVNSQISIAIADGVFAEYLIEPELIQVPGAVDYCDQVLHWRGAYVPVFDLSRLLGLPSLDNQHVGVLTYRDLNSQQLKYVGIKLYEQTEKVFVDDSAVCGFSDNFPLLLKPLVMSLFEYQNKLVSILNLADLCNDGYRDYIQAHKNVRQAKTVI